MNNYSPLRYPGGKNKTYNYVKHLIKKNEVETYIEPYCGGAGVALKLLFNNDVKKIMINDYDRSIYAMWYSIINYTDLFIEKIENVVFTMDEWEKQRLIQKNKEIADLLELGFSTFYLNRTNRSGIINAGPIGGKNQNGNYKMNCRFNSVVLKEKIRFISTYKNRIKLYNLDALDFIKKNIVRTKNSLTFFDPPYLVKGKDLYTNFYEFPDHVELSNTISKYMRNQKWILTYDVHDDIRRIYSDFEYFTYQLNYSAGSSKKGIEYIFLSDNLSSSEIEDYLVIR
ncbi:TPA: DNA adenine methylase [Listeria innocua]|uniref:DNA adenine methylase n=1 Tax=Listeria innocua TaxID=1642 RepID=UPI00086DB408|nr:DNA adenine methylase [Listeria innocua]OEO39052.1 DNA methyltransferase [Listeria monocytogenes]EDO1182278.1 DNA adenine methylase [Listeria innocua]EMC7503629.1 DNA adenine methylase [Listeria innocua]MBC1439464.1 DNA adenine methylase [Listeria innocua]MBC2131053.1 DNA adenine methylase [Listeria innocua]